VMSTWALLRLIKGGFFTADGQFKGLVPDAPTVIAVVLVALAVLLLVEMVAVLGGMRRSAAAPTSAS